MPLIICKFTVTAVVEAENGTQAEKVARRNIGIVGADAELESLTVATEKNLPSGWLESYPYRARGEDVCRTCAEILKEGK